MTYAYIATSTVYEVYDRTQYNQELCTIRTSEHYGDVNYLLLVDLGL